MWLNRVQTDREKVKNKKDRKKQISIVGTVTKIRENPSNPWKRSNGNTRPRFSSLPARSSYPSFVHLYIFIIQLLR